MGVDISVKSENNSPKKTYGCNSGAYKSALESINTGISLKIK